MRILFLYTIPTFLILSFLLAIELYMQAHVGIYGGNPLVPAGEQHDFYYYLALFVTTLAVFYRAKRNEVSVIRLWKFFALTIIPSVVIMALSHFIKNKDPGTVHYWDLICLLMFINVPLLLAAKQSVITVLKSLAILLFLLFNIAVAGVQVWRSDGYALSWSLAIAGSCVAATFLVRLKRPIAK